MSVKWVECWVEKYRNSLSVQLSWVQVATGHASYRPEYMYVCTCV